MRDRQRGASLITAIFIITALAALAAAMTRMTTHSAIDTAHELLSAQALYAAESGIDWAVYDILHGSGDGESDWRSLDGGSTWFGTEVDRWEITRSIDPDETEPYYRITSTGAAGGSGPADPAVQRVLEVYFMATLQE